ncbi:MAG: four helix bundle protein [Patescibacteria group bacterium]
MLNIPLKAPPRWILPIVEYAKDLYKVWISVYRNIPRSERIGIGHKIDGLCLELLELLRKATYAPVEEKITLLKRVGETVDALRFFMQLAWETSLIHARPYATLGEKIECLGRMVGGWSKELARRNPAHGGERRG